LLLHAPPVDAGAFAERAQLTRRVGQLGAGVQRRRAQREHAVVSLAQAEPRRERAQCPSQRGARLLRGYERQLGCALLTRHRVEQELEPRAPAGAEPGQQPAVQQPTIRVLTPLSLVVACLKQRAAIVLELVVVLRPLGR
jgi:hypothetical protein